MDRRVRRWRRRLGHRSRTGVAAYAVAVSAALVFVTLGLFVVALIGTEPVAALRAAPVADRVVRYVGTGHAGTSAGGDERDAAVAAAGRRLLADVPGAVYRIDASRTLLVSAGGSRPFASSAVVVASKDIGGNATLTAGRWPAAAGTGTETAAAGPIEVAVSDDFAGLHGIAPGAGLEAKDLAQAGGPADRPVQVVGVYHRAGAAASAFWQGMPPAALPDSGSGAVDVFVADPSSVSGTAGLGAAGTTTWIVEPRLDTLPPPQMSALEDRVAGAVAHQDARALPGAVAISPPIIVASRIPMRWSAARQDTLTGESELALPVGVLALLTGTAMFRAAGTVAARRGPGLVLSRTRGAGTAGLLTAMALEWIVVGALLAAAASLLASASARLLADTFGVRSLIFPASPGPAAAATAAVVVAVQAAMTIAASSAAATDRVPGGSARRRSGHAARFQRAGSDLVLIAVAGWGLFQLRHYRSPFAAAGDALQAGGQPGGSLDPVLLLVPALVAGALAVLMVRSLPPAARLLDRWARRGRGMTSAFGLWQVSRRTSRLGGALLLMVMAISIGALALTASAMRSRNTGDQAAFGVGADMRIDGSALPAQVRRSVYPALPGVRAATPMWSTHVTTTAVVDATQPTGATLVGIDPRTAGAAMAFGPGTASPAARAALSRLEAGDLAGLALPGEPTRIALTVTTTVSDGALPTGSILQVAVADADGVTGTFAEPLTASADHVEFDLTAGLPGTAKLAYPIRVVRISAVTPASPVGHAVRLGVRAVTGIDARGTSSGDTPPPAVGRAWVISDVETNQSGSAFGEPVPDAGSPTPKCPASAPQAEPGHSTVSTLCEAAPIPGDLFALNFVTGASATVNSDGDVPGPPQPGPFTAEAMLRPQTADVLPMPAVVSQAFLRQVAGKVGDTVTANVGGTDALDGYLSPAAGSATDVPAIVMKIEGVVDAVPGLPASAAVALVDLPSLSDRLSALGVADPSDDTWLLATSPGSDAAVAKAFADRPQLGTLTLAGDASTALREDVFRTGSAGLLGLCVVIAPLFAMLGFAMDTVVSIRERSRGFAALRAFGAHPRQLAAALWIEQGVVAGLALLSGIGVGVLVAAVTEPLLATSPDGSAAVPAMSVLVPWLRAFGLGGATVVGITGALWAIARVAARMDLARVLRAGEDA